MAIGYGSKDAAAVAAAYETPAALRTLERLLSLSNRH
jgi:hypothetical protein